MSVFVEGWGGYVPMKSIFEKFEFQAETGLQISHNLRAFIDVYVFGERITTFTIHGKCFTHTVQRPGEWIGDVTTGHTEFLPSYHGFEYLLAYYDTFRASAYGFPVTIAIGLGTIMRGLLQSVRVDHTDAENDLTSFSIVFALIPRESQIDLEDDEEDEE